MNKVLVRRSLLFALLAIVASALRLDAAEPSAIPKALLIGKQPDHPSQPHDFLSGPAAVAGQHQGERRRDGLGL